LSPRTAKHCPGCGAALGRASIEGRDRPCCPACGFVWYDNPASAAAGIVLDALGRVLLVRRAIEPFRGSWALPAGYQEADEEPAQAVVREVLEEAGIVVEVEELFDLVFVPHDVRRPANVAVFVCRAVGGTLRPGHDALEAAWFDLEALPAELGFDNGPRILEPFRRRR
jgi:ADP-ribose pyrophosphatase YjhB (NUDIX family)